jgi:glycosyltransferase involved in cell wall biosynthesis
VTAAKDEEDGMPRVARGILNQTIKPRLWVIVDDGSTDKTPEVIGVSGINRIGL